MNDLISKSPEGIEYSLPKKEDYKGEFERIRKLVDKARELGQEIVVVMGVGFVGSVMAAIVADTTDENGKSSKFVIGVQQVQEILLSCSLIIYKLFTI